MERTDQKHILVLITNPFAVINMVHSGLIRELGKHYRISIMSDLLSESDITHFNRHFRSNMLCLEAPVPTISGLTKWLRIIQMLFFSHHFGLETIRIKLMERSSIFHRLFCISRRSRLLIWLSGRLMVSIRNWLISRTTLPDLYAKVATRDFCAVISTSPLDLRENAIANSLRPYGIPCVSIIISWDNLTSKGIINAESGMVLLWNETMASEYRRFYPVFRDNALVRITGIPRFDIYFRRPSVRNPIYRHTSELHSQTRAILFCTGAVKHHSCQNYIIRDLLDYAEERPGVMIWVRCHPGDDMKRYACFNGIRNLRFFQPFGENTGRIPPADFLEILHSQLTSCAVCVQVASTMLLDAAACDKPCISIAYDAHPGTHYVGSVKRFYDYCHQIPLQNHLKEQLVHDRRELFSKLDKILMDGNISSGLRNAIGPFIHHYVPDSVRLTAQYIREWLG